MEQVLTDRQLSEFRQLLKERYRIVREQIRDELLRSDEEQYLELAGRVHDPEDEAVADLLVDLNLASIDRHVREVRAIDAALIRLAEGSYGICVDCEQPIGLARLRAHPTAARCLECQKAYEQTLDNLHAGDETPSL